LYLFFLCLCLYLSVHSSLLFCIFFFFNASATTEIYTLSLHDALPICAWDIQLVPSRENHATLDKVFQLANVAWPLSVHQRLHGLLWHKLNPLLHLARVAQNKMMHQQWNVFTPFAKRRNLDWENIQAVKE